MKIGIRKPSLKRRISARTSLKRIVRHRMGIKMPKGMGFISDPKKAIYNKIYNKTSMSVDSLAKKVLKNNQNSQTIFSNNADNWNTANFNSKAELLKEAKEKNIRTNGKEKCKSCGHDLWAIAHVKILFIGGDAVFCQDCGKPGVKVEELNKVRV